MGKRGTTARRVGGGFTLLIFLLLLTGCGGGAASLKPAAPDEGATTVLAEGRFDAAGSFDSLPFPQDEPLDESELVSRRSNYSQTIVRLGDEYYGKADNAAVNVGLHVMQLIAGPQEPAWAIYRFNGILQDDLPALVTVELLPELTQRCYFGLACLDDSSSSTGIFSKPC